MNDIRHLLEEEQRLYFSGVDQSTKTQTIPEDIAEQHNRPQAVENTLADIVEVLPRAASSDIQVRNKFVDETDTLDIDGIRERLEDSDCNIDIKSVVDEVNISDLEPNQYEDMHDYKVIVDPRRMALSALGYSTQYWWQVAKSYTIINPPSGYNPLMTVLRSAGHQNDVFGWVDIRDWGGSIDLYIFFRSETISAPGQQSDDNLSGANSDSQDGEETDEDDQDQIYLGLRTGYDFSGGRAFDTRLCGYNTDGGTWLFTLSGRHSRRHQGSIVDIKQEIKEWWEQEMEYIKAQASRFTKVIRKAERRTIDFEACDFTLETFYELLGINRNDDTEDGYANLAANRIRKNTDSQVISAWTLGHSLLLTLEENFESHNGDKHNSLRFRTFSKKALNIIRRPDTQIREVTTEFNALQNRHTPSTNQVQLAEEIDVESLSFVDSKGVATVINKKTDAVNHAQQTLLEDTTDTMTT